MLAMAEPTCNSEVWTRSYSQAPQEASHMRVPRVCVSVRAMMLLILMLGAGFGWVAHRARVQRDAVAGIEQDAGRVFYEWDWSPSQVTPNGATFRPKPGRELNWPRWMIDTLGVDFYGEVKKVIIRRHPDMLMAH